MKKLLVLMMALTMLALALPALAQPVDSNDINNNTNGAFGNTQGYGNTNTSQFQGANFGNQSNAVLNNTNAQAVGNLSGNNFQSDFGLINESPISILNSGSVATTETNTIVLTAVLNGSLNDNTVYVGNMANAWTNQHTWEHQNDHQMNFPATFYGSTDDVIFMPISNTHMEQANTGIVAGDYAGSVNGANLVNLDRANVSGMFALNTNMGGVGTNQALLNAVTAFSAPAP